MILEALKKLSNKIVNNNVEWENQYRPNHITDSEREKFFTNFDRKLIQRVRDERQSKN